MNDKGLAAPVKTQDDILSMTRKVFGKSNKQPRSLEQRLQGLSEKDLKLVLQTAQYVKLANGMGNPEPYQVTADFMYPRMNTGIRRLVAEVLEVAEPLNIPDNRASEQDRLQQVTLDSYALEMSKAKL